MSKEVIIGRGDKFGGSPRAGSHILSAKLGIELEGDATSRDWCFEQEIVIDVRLERFQPPEVVFRHPQPGTTSAAGSIIPHIVLAKPGLPWERPIYENQPPDTPNSWLALLAFAGKKHEIHSGTVEDLVKPAEGTWLPHLTIQSWEKGRACRYIEVAMEDFREAAPRGHELFALSHIQQPGSVTPPESPDPGMFEGDGKITSVLLNRMSIEGLLPQDSKNGLTGVEVHLISLEGCFPLLSTLDASVGRFTEKRIRLLLLDSWSFTHDGSKGAGDENQFRNACNGLTPCNLRLPGDSLNEQGYVRFGDETQRLYYRGPLLPGPIEERLEASSDYFVGRSWEDPEKCLFALEGPEKGLDISFAAAWQMGRLVAMGDPAIGELFARVRAGWRYLSAVRHRNPGSGWGEKQNAETDAALRRMSDEDYEAGIWISRLWLLEKVPLHYLIPDPAMLPRESICPVYLDRMWADAWCSGAFSAGSHSPQDFPLGSVDGKQLMEAGSQAKCRELGVSGLLVRSRLVLDWPSLIIEFFNKDEPERPLPIVRKARIGPDVLLVLAEGSYRSAVFKLPSDSAHFRAKPPRYLTAEGEVSPRNTAEKSAHLAAAIQFDFTHEQSS